MRMNRVSGVAVAAVVLALLLGSWDHFSERNAHAAAKPAVVWQYKVIGVGTAQNPDDLLNQAGMDGWELVSACSLGENRGREYILKRPAP